MTAGEARTRTRDLNRGCHCITLDRTALLRALEAETGEPGLWSVLAASHAHLFSSTPLFVAGEGQTTNLRAPGGGFAPVYRV